MNLLESIVADCGAKRIREVALCRRAAVVFLLDGGMSL